MTPDTEPLTIQAVAERTGLTTHTLRYYERIGLMAPIGRAESGHRRYFDSDLEWLELLQRLRATGMPIREMQRFAELARQGDATISERRALLEVHQQKLEAQMREIQRTLTLLEHKVSTYRTWEADHHGASTRSEDK